MTKRKVKRLKLQTVTVDCDDLVYEDENGEELPLRPGETVTFFRRLPSKLVRMLIQIMNMEKEEDQEEVAFRMGKIMEDLIPLLERVIKEWTWTDILNEDRPLLPSPPTQEDLWNLDVDEVFYLSGKLAEQMQAPKEQS